MYENVPMKDEAMTHNRVEVEIAGVKAVAEMTDDGAVTFATENTYLASRIERAAAAHERVAMVPGVPYVTYRAGREDVLAITAALFAADTGHTLLVSAPASVERLFRLAEARTAPIPIIGYTKKS